MQIQKTSSSMGIKKVMMLTTTAYMSERFNRNNILILNKIGYHVDVVANWECGNPTTSDVLDAFKDWLGQTGNEWTNVPIVRNPVALCNKKAIMECLDLISEKNYSLIHCHTPVGGAVGRVIAHKTKTPVIYTAHGFHFFDGASKLNWAIFYPVEKILSNWTDILITINSEDYERAKKSFHAKKLEQLHGVGVDTNKYYEDKNTRTRIRRELGVLDDETMLLSVGDRYFNYNKL